MGTANLNMAGNVPIWHAMSQADVANRLATNLERGLNLPEASARLEAFGPNRLPAGRKRGPLMRFLAQFKNILIYVLIARR